MLLQPTEEREAETRAGVDTGRRTSQKQQQETVGKEAEQILQNRQKRVDQAEALRQKRLQHKQQQRQDRQRPGSRAGGRLLGADLQQNKGPKVTEWQTRAGYTDYQGLESLVQAEIAQRVRDGSHGTTWESWESQSGRPDTEEAHGEIDDPISQQGNKQVLQTAQEIIQKIETALQGRQGLCSPERSQIIMDWKKVQEENEQ